jgi:hypothetical protein
LYITDGISFPLPEPLVAQLDRGTSLLLMQFFAPPEQSQHLLALTAFSCGVREQAH